jgi:hypothetical protein
MDSYLLNLDSISKSIKFDGVGGIIKIRNTNNKNEVVLDVNSNFRKPGHNSDIVSLIAFFINKGLRIEKMLTYGGNYVPFDFKPKVSFDINKIENLEFIKNVNKKLETLCSADNLLTLRKGLRINNMIRIYNQALLMFPDFFDKNDLPNALRFLRQYKNEGKANVENLQYQIIPKEKIKNNPQHYFLQKKYQQIETPETDTPVLPLGELIEERKEKAKDKKIQVWSVSNKYGFVNSEDYFDKKIASADTKNYKVVKPNYFAFNPSRVNVGSIACNFTDNLGIVSPMYTLISFDVFKK